MRLHLIAALAALPLAAPPLVPALAQTAPPAGMQIDPVHIRAKQLMDRDVHTTDDVQVGEIEDLVLDPASGRIVSVVIEVENRLGLTDRYVAVELSRLRMTPGERRITLDVTREGVRSLRGIRYSD